MRRTRTAWLIGGILVVATAAICAPALARGPKGHDGGSHDEQLWLLARAAGVPRTQIMTAFQNDANLKSDFANVRTTRQALQACLLSSPNSCSSQISAYGSAVQALSQERMNVWATVFGGASNLQQAATVQGQLDQLHAQRKQIFQQIFGSSSTGEGPSSTGG
jgi:cell division septation protein DedD